jgi:hypothetical protein
LGHVPGGGRLAGAGLDGRPEGGLPPSGHSRQEWRSTIEPGETLVEGHRYLIAATVEPESELVTSCWFTLRNAI